MWYNPVVELCKSFTTGYNFTMLEVKDKKLKRVGVLRGGAGKHYASSLQKGGEVISCIFENLGDKVIYDDFTLTFNIVAKKK